MAAAGEISGAWLAWYDPAGNGGNGDPAWSHDPADDRTDASSCTECPNTRAISSTLRAGTLLGRLAS